jgi:NRPS condensation-like uncharacterized protein
MQSQQRASALSQLDAFFVAYQERTGILMQHGVEVEIKGELQPQHVEEALAYLLCRWPRLGQTLRSGVAGLTWSGDCLLKEMLQTADGNGAVSRWRNKPLDPFREPPFQILCIYGREKSTLAFRAHHALTDGEALFALCADALRVLARLSNNERLPAPNIAAGLKLTELISPSRLLRQKKLPGMWRYTRWLAAEAKAGRSMPLKMRACHPGEIATCERMLDAAACERIKQRAVKASVTPAWLCAAAWVRAIGAWNTAQQVTAPGRQVSLEVPVSLRPRRDGTDAIGNFVSPLILFADPIEPLEKIAREMQEQLKTGLRQRSHLGVPLFTTPARYLPWPLFRRLAVNQSSTGFATSHFTWLEQNTHIYSEVEKLSGGALQLLDHHIYTPVCLHMGAALAAVVLAGGTKLSLTYRLTGFSSLDAEKLLDTVVAELHDESQSS